MWRGLSVSALAIFTVTFGNTLTGWVASAAFIGTIVLTTVGILELGSYFIGVYTTHMERLREVQAMSPALKFMELLASLTEGAQEIVAEKWGAEIRSLGRIGAQFNGDPYLLIQVRIGSIDIPLDFIQEFLSKSDHRFMCPITTWSEGSVYRKYAQVLTEYLIGLGWGEKSVGNKPAKWKNKSSGRSYYFAAHDLYLMDNYKKKRLIWVDDEGDNDNEETGNKSRYSGRGSTGSAITPEPRSETAGQATE